MDETRPGDDPSSVPVDDVLAAIERTLDRATYKLGRLRSRQRGSALARDLTSLFYDVTAARHDVARLRDEIGESATRPAPE